MRIDLKRNSLVEFLEELKVEPSERTRFLLNCDPGRTIEDTFGYERAMLLSKGFPMYVGNLPIGEMRQRSVTADLLEHGYKEAGFVLEGSFGKSKNQLDKEYGADNVVVIPQQVLSGIENLRGKYFYFFIKPFQEEPQYLEMNDLPAETLFESSIRSWEEKLVPYERGRLTVMEYGKPVVTEVFALGITTDLGLFKYGTQLDAYGRVRDYKTISLRKIKTYRKVVEK